MNAVKLSFADLLKIEGNIEHYHIPKYQREYTWGKYNWEALFNDIIENDADYFIGSLIVVNRQTSSRPGEEKIYEVIDGQQRLSTLSVFLCAIYYKYGEFLEVVDPEDEDEKKDFTIRMDSIKRKLIKKKKEFFPDEIGGFLENKHMSFLRVQPSTQNNNLEDYKYILYDCGVLQNGKEPKNYGNRRFSKAYNYFYDQLPSSKHELDLLLDKINRLVFIHISVSSQVDAFTLFEALNNRGVPLSAIDIIKNNLLSEMEKKHKIDIDESYERWQNLMGYVPEFSDQERYLRQYYNSFKVYDHIKVNRITRATKSTLLAIYEKLISSNAQLIFSDLLEKAKVYSRFINPQIEEDERIATRLNELSIIGASSCYTLLLFLFCNKEHLLHPETIIDTLDFLIKYYVRRNVTDLPNTRDLDAINIEVVEGCHNIISEGKKIEVLDIIKAHLETTKAPPANMELFKEYLADNLFYYNSGMARYVITKLDSIAHNREYKPDLWERNPTNNNHIWTVEHILPQGKMIPKYWVDMVADGDGERAIEIQEKWVHCLGNLTLSAYNSNLSNKSFQEKQEKGIKNVLDYKIAIGYKNGLALNKFSFPINGTEESLATIKYWNESSIKARNDKMVEVLLTIFSFAHEK